VERNRKAGQNPPRVVAPIEDEEDPLPTVTMVVPMPVSVTLYYIVCLFMFSNSFHFFSGASGSVRP